MVTDYVVWVTSVYKTGLTEPSYLGLVFIICHQETYVWHHIWFVQFFIYSLFVWLQNVAHTKIFSRNSLEICQISFHFKSHIMQKSGNLITDTSRCCCNPSGCGDVKPAPSQHFHPLKKRTISFLMSLNKEPVCFAGEAVSGVRIRNSHLSWLTSPLSLESGSGSLSYSARKAGTQWDFLAQRKMHVNNMSTKCEIRRKRQQQSSHTISLPQVSHAWQWGNSYWDISTICF